MKRKKRLSLLVALMLLLGFGSNAMAGTTTVTIPYLDYVVRQTVSQSNYVTFVYKNTTPNNGSVVFRISNPEYNDNSTSQVASQITGTYSLTFANGSTTSLGTVSGSNLSGGTNYFPPNATFVVNLKAAPGVNATGFKIKFSPQ